MGTGASGGVSDEAQAAPAASSEQPAEQPAWFSPASTPVAPPEPVLMLDADADAGADAPSVAVEQVTESPAFALPFPASARQLPLSPVPELLASLAQSVPPGVRTAGPREHLRAERVRAGAPAAAHLLTPGGVVLSLLFTLACLMFVLVEPTPRWAALVGAAVAALGADGVLRTARREPFANGADTTPFVYLPAMFAFAAPVFIEYGVAGYWVWPAALAAGGLFALLLAAEVASVLALDRWFAPARFIAAAAAYGVTFALCALTYLFGLAVGPAVLAVGLVGVLLAVELLREGEFDPLETLAFAAVTGLVLAQARWVLHYLPLDGYVAGLALVIVFYLTVGVLHAYMTRHLTREVAAEYAMVTVAGLALVVAARVTGVA